MEISALSALLNSSRYYRIWSGSPKARQSEPYLLYVECDLLGGATPNNVERFLVLLLVTGKSGCGLLVSFLNRYRKNTHLSSSPSGVSGVQYSALAVLQ